MIFPQFRQYRNRYSNLADAIGYLTTDLLYNFNILTTGLRKLSFSDNFAGFLVKDITITPGIEAIIANQLGEPVTQRIVVRGGAGSQNIVDGDTEWTATQVSLKNTGGSPVTISVVFLK
jgi:hypothetical protein